MCSTPPARRAGPKGVLITNANYLYVGQVVAEYLRLRPEDRDLIVLPLFHGNAQYYSTMSSLVTGASIGLAPKFSASRWSEQATVLGATVASLFAAPIRMILAQAPSPYDRKHAVRVAMFAQNMTDSQTAEFEDRFGISARPAVRHDRDDRTAHAEPALRRASPRDDRAGRGRHARFASSARTA